jgi:sigma-B regulation protein RsbU (phosphoserine phosphatase)
MTEKALQVLLVEDSAGDVRLLREMFKREKPGSYRLSHAVRMSEAEVHLAKGDVDIVLLDMGLPDGHGINTVRRALLAGPNVPMIVLTGLDDEALAAEAMKEGAQDYLIKGQIESRALPRALRYAIERHHMQAEHDLIRAQQLQFKDDFLSHVSHELRSPLNAIYQFVSILIDRIHGELNVEQNSDLEIVLRNVNQLKSMINDLFEVAGEQTGKLKLDLQHTSLSEAINYVTDTFRGTAINKGVSLSSDIDDPLPPLWADPTRLRQILIILVDNAIKFTPAKGAVQVKAHIVEDDSNCLMVEVSDTGCGISSTMTERIFDRLVQSSQEPVGGRRGLGLGLHICKDLIAQHGGTIWADSTLGKGTTFFVRLPLSCLSALIAPALGEQKGAYRPITLVITEIRSDTGSLPEEVRAEQSRIVRNIVQRCLRSDLDVLLPKMGCTGIGELLFTVATTDEIGGQAVARRILEQVDASALAQEANLKISTSCRSLAMPPRNSRDSREQVLGKVTGQLQEIMNEEISVRTVKSGK